MIVPRYTREIPQRFRLEASKCTSCGYITFPPRRVCPECGNRQFETIRLKPEGKILTYTVIHAAADEFATQTPYAVGIIETADGARLTAQIVDCNLSDLAIGKKVELVFRRVQKEGHAGILQYGYKAVLKE